MSHLNGKHVVITGGSNGIGFATAKRFAKKGMARAIVRNLASELLELGIRINCLAPGPVHTNIFMRMTGGDESEAQAVIDRISATVPLKRVGTPEEIAEAVEFMTGPGAASMVGSELTLDGGKAEL